MNVFDAVHSILNPSSEGLRRLAGSDHDVLFKYIDFTKYDTKVAAEFVLAVNNKSAYKDFCKSFSGKPKKVRVPFASVLEMDKKYATGPFDRKSAFLKWLGLVKTKKFSGTLTLHIWRNIPESIQCTGEEEYEIAKVFRGLSIYAPTGDFFQLILCKDRSDSQADSLVSFFGLERHYHRCPINSDAQLMKAVARRIIEKVSHNDLPPVEEFEAFVQNQEVVNYYKDLYDISSVMAT
jgi:hypothetical protein